MEIIRPIVRARRRARPDQIIERVGLQFRTLVGSAVKRCGRNPRRISGHGSGRESIVATSSQMQVAFGIIINASAPIFPAAAAVEFACVGVRSVLQRPPGSPRAPRPHVRGSCRQVITILRRSPQTTASREQRTQYMTSAPRTPRADRSSSELQSRGTLKSAGRRNLPFQECANS